ncbi:peroxisomal coenzyme A diphosphatase NUDT7-like [Haliotis cracherodii]|uniref:peroxisomal coenzyme A diphosphatase NUDT7-like n=1 Tax=Haliotis cracherodii TaxID=6455 RepID=UPI0039EC2207
MMASHAFSSPTVDEVKARLEKYDVRASQTFPESVYDHLRRSSVLLPLLFRNDTLHVLLTLRSSKLRHHASTVAFPGGRKEEGDVDDVATALREAEEEIGLPSSKVEVVSCLVPSFFRPDYSVFPIVGFIPDDFKPVPNADEVEIVFTVPLVRFLQNDFVTKETTLLGRKMHVSFFPCETEMGEVFVWGGTALMCVLLAAIVYQETSSASMFGKSRSSEEMAKDMEDFFLKMCEYTKLQPKL